MGWQLGRGRPDLRVGTPERERALALLGEHLGAGRIDVAEYEQRCSGVTAAQFESEVAALFTDLPQPRPELAAAPGASRRPPRTTALLWSCVGLAVVVLAVVTKQALLLALLLLGAVFLFRRHR